MSEFTRRRLVRDAKESAFPARARHPHYLTQVWAITLQLFDTTSQTRFQKT
jgi:hypothetical protein